MTTAHEPPTDRGQAAQAAGRYFRHMAQFVGFSEKDAAAIKESALVIEKYIPQIVAEFYDHLLRYPPTRKYFLDANGEIDREYLRLRMVHNTTFWRRAASGEYDDAFAMYIDQVGHAHTSKGADPNIYIPERYVIGQMGFVQRAISEALHNELHDLHPDLESRATRAWNLLLMVILELLARAYSDEHEVELGAPSEVNSEEVHQLAVDTYERGLGLYRTIEHSETVIGKARDVPDGERLIVQVDDVSVGVFHHDGKWYAVRNHCLHRAGPVATGTLDGDTLTCPWHGYQYRLTTGEYLNDPSITLDTYQVEVRGEDLILRVPHITMGSDPDSGPNDDKADMPTLEPNEFLVAEAPPGTTLEVLVDGEPVAVYNLRGQFHATHGICTHAAGSLSQGGLEGDEVICPLHGSRFSVRDGAVRKGPASQPLRVFHVHIEGDIGRVESDGTLRQSE